MTCSAPTFSTVPPPGTSSRLFFLPVILQKALLASGASLALLTASYAGAREDGTPDTIAQRALACVTCHGKEGRATRDGYFPRIAGKPAGYLYNQLINFREGRRQYPQMTYLVAHLSDDYLRELADYFSRLNPPYPLPQPVRMSSQDLERGRQLVMRGDATRNVPACISCHGSKLTGVLPATPGLLGLPRDYINAQFGAWKTGARRAADPDCMAQISKQLTPEDIGAVSAWLSAQPPAKDAVPASALANDPPVSCGSVPK